MQLMPFSIPAPKMFILRILLHKFSGKSPSDTRETSHQIIGTRMFSASGKILSFTLLLLTFSCGGGSGLKNPEAPCSTSPEKLEQGLCKTHLHWLEETRRFRSPKRFALSNLKVKAIHPDGKRVSYRIGNATTCGVNWNLNSMLMGFQECCLALQETSLNPVV